jgi:protein-S-isoprenylcysteine O-methyltransferase Ste14
MTGKHALFRFLTRTPVRSFVLMPLAVAAFEFTRRSGTLAFDPLGLPLLAWGYLQYRLVGLYRIARGGGGPGLEVPPERLVTSGPYRFMRNPMYLRHLIFFAGLAVTFGSYFAVALLLGHAIWFDRRVRADEARLATRFGAEYRDYMGRVRRWLPGLA